MKILYIEDSEDYIKPVQRMATYLGHEITIATTGTQGYLLAQDRPDLILLDINLPDANGLALARRLRADALTMPIVIVTADAVNYDRQQALEAGADDFLTKPVSLEIIKALFTRFNH